MEQIDDYNQFVGIFPEEVWILLATTYIDYSDFHNVLNASAYFQKILKHYRVVFLFPKVWRILGAKNMKMDRMNVLDRCPDSVRDILRLRLVCRTWWHTVDELLQSDGNFLKLRDDDETNAAFYTFSNMFAVPAPTQLRSVSQFLSHFSATHWDGNRSPFIGRSVTLAYGMLRARSNEEASDDFCRLLERYGHHVVEFEIYVGNTGDNIVTFYNSLRSWLSLMPRLKFFTFKSTHYISFPEEIAELQEEYAHRHMPQLNHLQSVRLETISSDFGVEILKSNTHVTMLALNGNCCDIDIFSMSLSNLRQLQIRIDTEWHLKSLDSTAQDWPLEILVLEFDRRANVDWSRIFNLLQRKWRRTLKRLVLQLPESPMLAKLSKRVMKECQSLKLDLPRLENIKIVMPNYAPLDFLLPMANNLRDLRVEVRFNRKQVKTLHHATLGKYKEKIELIGHGGRMTKSNIWSIFPKLEYAFVSTSYGS